MSWVANEADSEWRQCQLEFCYSVCSPCHDTDGESISTVVQPKTSSTQTWAAPATIWLFESTSLHFSPCSCYLVNKLEQTIASLQKPPAEDWKACRMGSNIIFPLPNQNPQPPFIQLNTETRYLSTSSWIHVDFPHIWEVWWCRASTSRASKKICLSVWVPMYVKSMHICMCIKDFFMGKCMDVGKETKAIMHIDTVIKLSL